jgi:hypothetical protein
LVHGTADENRPPPEPPPAAWALDVGPADLVLDGFSDPRSEVLMGSLAQAVAKHATTAIANTAREGTLISMVSTLTKRPTE